MMEQTRPTKKQKELLHFIEEFIAQHGYGPSYREIMRGCNYSSSATVALHVNNLVARGHLQKKRRSARSIEVVGGGSAKQGVKTNIVSPSDEKWLVDQIEHRLNQAENGKVTQAELDNLYILVAALTVLGLSGASRSFKPRLSELKDKIY